MTPSWPSASRPTRTPSLRRGVQPGHRSDGGGGRAADLRRIADTDHRHRLVARLRRPGSVTEDMLGLTPSPARFVKRYAQLGEAIEAAAAEFAAEVRSGDFPPANTSIRRARRENRERTAGRRAHNRRPAPAHRRPRMSPPRSQRRLTARDIRARKGGEKIVCLTMTGTPRRTRKATWSRPSLRRPRA